MLTFHANMPALPPAMLRRLYVFHFLWQAVLGGVAAWLFGPGLPAAFVFAGGVLAGHLAAEVSLRRWARRHAISFIPRRAWRTAWRDGTDPAPAPWFFAGALLFSLGIVQLTQGRPVWALSLPNWAGVAFCAVAFFLVGLCARRLPD